MKSSFFSLVFLLCSSINTICSISFEDWVHTHKINVTDHIYKNWLDNENYINKINSLNLTYSLGHNAYSGYSSEEFSNIMGFKNSHEKVVGQEQELIGNIELPVSIDWRQKGVVNNVKDQGQCGSCWAFSTISSVESAVAIKTGVLNSLSEQQLVDCDSLMYGGRDHGCNGGLMDNAFTWIHNNNGVCSGASYPYMSGNTKTAGICQKTCKNVVNTAVVKYIDIQKNSDTAMMNALALQPVSVAIEADQKDFQLYSSGVFTAGCGTNLDHGVGLVGYGTMNNVDYYILRNSWGSSWGSGGYMYLGRGNNPNTGNPYNNGAGQCGVLGEASYPVM